MKNLFLALSLSLAIGAVFTLNSCKKETTEDDSVSAQDAGTITTAMSTSGDDASASAGQVQAFTGKTQGLYQALCGVTLLDTSSIHQITLTYDGTSDCFGITRSGTITVALTNGTHWQDVGAQLTVTYNGLKVTDVISGASFTLNGTHTITNQLGGLAWKLAYGLVTNDSTIHNFTSSNMSITFPNGSQRTWTFNRSREWTSAVVGGHNTITLTDYTTNSGGIDVTGTNRYGNAFTNAILTPISSDNNVGCLYKPYQGKTQHVVGGRTTTVTYGTNLTGTQDGSATVCGSGFYISYVNANNGHSASRFVPYW
jgi:hypothetical protein